MEIGLNPQSHCCSVIYNHFSCCCFIFFKLARYHWTKENWPVFLEVFIVTYSVMIKLEKFRLFTLNLDNFCRPCARTTVVEKYWSQGAIQAEKHVLCSSLFSSYSTEWASLGFHTSLTLTHHGKNTRSKAVPLRHIMLH